MSGSYFKADADTILRTLYGLPGLDREMRKVGTELVNNARATLNAAGTTEATAAARLVTYKAPSNGPGVNSASYPLNRLYKNVVKADRNPNLGAVSYRTGLVVSDHPASQFLEVGTSRRTPLKFMEGALKKSSIKNVVASGAPGSRNTIVRWIYANAITRPKSTKSKGRK